MIRKTLKNSIAALAVIVAGQSAFAQGVPTIDLNSWAELISLVGVNKEMLGIDADILTNATDQLTRMQEQLSQLQATHNAITGARDTVGSLFDGDIDPRTLASSLNGLSLTGKTVNNRLGTHMKKLRSDYQPIAGLQAFGRAQEDPQTRAHDLVSGASMAGLAVAQESFSGAGEAMKRYDGYRKEIAKTDDLKASVDLNTRIAVENGMMLSALLQALSAQGQLDAALVNERLRGRDRATRLSIQPKGAN